MSIIGAAVVLSAALTLQQDTSLYRSESVTYPNGDITLAAELMLPLRPGPHPAAVIIQGSGPSDRRNQWARAIAEELVKNGVTTLLTDKRGSGASGGDWMTAGFEELADDALAGVRFLGKRAEVEARRIGLVGLSQGGWIAPVAAARGDSVAFVINISGANVSYAEQSFHEMANTARQAGLSEGEVQEVLALNRAAGRYLVGGSWDDYAAARGRGLQSSWGKIAEGFPAARDLPIWTFLRKVAAFDPVPYWMLSPQPKLVVLGEDDERDNVPVQESVRRLEQALSNAGEGNFQVVVIPKAGHALMNPGRTALAPEFVAALAAWLKRHATGG